MSTFRVNQIRSGEGWILTDPSNLGPEIFASDLSDLLVGPLLIASEEFESWTPPGGEQLEAHLYAFAGEAARAMLRDWKRWGSRRAIAACMPALPDADARRRWMPDALRPWDAERLGATFYAQVGSEWAQQGSWLAQERDRARFVEAAVSRLLEVHGAKLPNGDVTLVLELPTDSTFEASFRVTGAGKDLRLRRDFPSRQISRDWFIHTGDWQAVERKVARSVGQGLKRSLMQGVATVGIIVLSIPVFVMVGLAALLAKFTGGATEVSTTTRPAPR